MTRTVKAWFDVVKVGYDFVLLTDQNGPKSITNDAEAVYECIQAEYPAYRVAYIDSVGDYTEITMIENFAKFRMLGQSEIDQIKTQHKLNELQNL